MTADPTGPERATGEPGSQSGVLGRLGIGSVLDDRWRTLALLAPLLVLDLGVFVLPMGYLLRVSLAGRTPDGAFVEGSWSVDGYRYVLDTGSVRSVVAFTLGFAALVTVLSAAIGVCYAYAVWRSDGRTRTVLLGAAVLSLFATLVVKLFAVVLVFSPVGVLNDVLSAAGLGPVVLVDNLPGAVLAQLYVVVPYSILSVYAVLSGLDDRLVEAARDLGASRVRVVREVVLPRARPGVVVGAVVSFTWSVGAYAAPLLVGSGSERTAGILVARLVGRRYDWPAAAALAVVLVAVVFGAVALAARRAGGVLGAD